MSNENAPIQKTYNELKNKLDILSLSDRLFIISNLIFDTYPQARKSDIIYNELDKEEIFPLESYSLLAETYAFHEDSFVFRILNTAHDLLSISNKLRHLKFGTE